MASGERGLSVQVKFVIVCVACITLIMGAEAAFQIVQTRSTELSRLSEESRNTVARMEQNLELPMWNVSKDQVDAIIATEMRDKAIVYVAVTGENGEELSAQAQGRQAKSDIILEGTITRENSRLGTFTLRESTSAVENALHQEVLMTLIQVAVLDLILSLIVSLLLRVLVISPLSGVRRVLREISQGSGDLSQEIVVHSRDEIGAIALHFNDFRSSLAVMIKSIIDSTGQLELSAASLASNTEETAASANQIASNLASMGTQIAMQIESVRTSAHTVEEISRALDAQRDSIIEQTEHVEKSSRSIADMSGTLEQVSTNIYGSAATFAELLEAGDEGKKRLKLAADGVREIFKASNGLLETTNTIADIASQTNLLAMNAAIEAAHAGESGKGFAVVAAEIRKLAENSSTQARQTEESLKQIVAVIGQVFEASQAVEKSFERLNDLIARIDEAQKKNIRYIDEHSQISKASVSILQDVHRISKEIRTISDRLSSDNVGIKAQMVRLNEISSVVQSGMAEVMSGNDEINKAVQAVSRLSADNKDSIRALVEQTGKFKIA